MRKATHNNTLSTHYLYYIILTHLMWTSEWVSLFSKAWNLKTLVYQNSPDYSVYLEQFIRKILKLDKFLNTVDKWVETMTSTNSVERTRQKELCRFYLLIASAKWSILVRAWSNMVQSPGMLKSQMQLLSICNVCKSCLVEFSCKQESYVYIQCFPQEHSVYPWGLTCWMHFLPHKTFTKPIFWIF